MNLRAFEQNSKRDYKRMRSFLAGVKKKKPDELDEKFHNLHEEVFETVECLACANCCKTTSPLFVNADIERIAKHLKIKPGQFIQKYLRIDEEGDYVLQVSPCSFLDADNYCSIYDVRPKACREYPHTNRKKMHQILELTAKNTQVCPAVFRIVQRLESEVYPKK